jgi:hypothetical protein
VVLPNSGAFPKVTLTTPSSQGYILLGFEIDRRPGLLYWLESAHKKQVLAELGLWADRLRARDDVDEVTLFKALVIPPGREQAFKTDVSIPLTRYDVVVLVTLADLAAAKRLAADPGFLQSDGKPVAEGHAPITVVAENVRRIAPVDHSRKGVFLFNFFAARSREQNLAVWDYTAGWFQDRTGLDNSTLLLPVEDDVAYSVINHCRWNRLRDVVPHLIFEASFRSYVLKHFAANHTTSVPVLYRLA